MPATSVTLVPTTTFGTPVGNYDGSSTSFDSVAKKGDGWYGYGDGNHTVAYFPNGFTGTIKMQGSLAETPTSTDWFDISGTTTGALTANSTAVTYNFTGNFVWVRAAITGFTAGTLTKIMMNH